MCKRVPSRVWVIVMIFWGSFVNYMFRSHYQISLLAIMAPRKNVTVKDFGPRYNWTYQWEQQSISALFYGVAIVSLPAGFFITSFGPWHVMFWTTVIMVISSDVIVPIVNNIGPGAVFIMRLIVGIMVGLQDPAMQKIAKNWTPSKENKGQFSFCLWGNAFGSIVTMPLSSLVIEDFGWSWSFYYTNVVALLFCVAFFLLVADHPRDYRWIRQEELDMIENSQMETDNESSKKVNPPYTSMIASSAFWAVIVAHFGNHFNFYLTLTTVPQFFNRKLKFGFEATARLAALPHVAGLFLGAPYGVIQNWLLRKGASEKICGTIFIFVPHVLAGFILMYIRKIEDCPAVYSVSFIVVMMIFNGSAMASVLTYPQYITTNWQETVYSTMNFFGHFGGLVGPILVSKLTDENTNEGWALVFFTGGLISILTGLFFRYFVEFKIQPWNEPVQNQQNE